MEANLPTGKEPKKSNLVPILLDEEMGYVLAVMLGQAMTDRLAMLQMSIALAKVNIGVEAIERLQKELMKLRELDGQNIGRTMKKDVPPPPLS